MLQKIHDSLYIGKWVVGIILGLIACSFVFWNIDFGFTGPSFAARVNGDEIALTEFDRALQDRQNQFQRQYRIELTEDLRREMRRAVIDDLVRSTALKQRVREQGYHASPARVDQAIQGITAFQVEGVFNEQVAVGLLANQGLTPAGFRVLQREELEVGDLQGGILDSTFLTPAEFRRYIELYNQRREIAYALFDPATYTAGVMIDDAAIATRYENNQASYQTTESVDLEYVELALADIAAKVEVSEDELRSAYQEERARFETAEERHARHILIAVAEGQEDAARATAENVIARVRGGEDFGAVAAEVSADAGSKAQGGDLGWMARGTLPGAFEDALFALQVGDLSAPVRTDQGFHVIRVEEVRAGEVQPFEAVREEVSAELRTRRAENEFYDRGSDLRDKAFDAYNELKSVAEAVQLPVKTLNGFPRTGDASVFGDNNAAVVQAAFGDEIVDSGRNSDLVQLGDDRALVLRVTTHHVPTTKPLDEVREQVRAELTRERAEQLAEEAAEAFLAALGAGGDPAALAAAGRGTWHPAAWIMRTDANVPTEVLSGAFGMAKSAAGVQQREVIALAGGGQAVIVVSGIEPGEPASMTQSERDQRQRQLADQAARAEFTAYIGNVRDEADVRIPDAVLEPPAY